VSGGKLSDEKSMFYALDWNFSPGGKPTMVDCLDTSDNQQQHHLAGNQVKVADHHKSLGHLLSQNILNLEKNTKWNKLVNPSIPPFYNTLLLRNV
jgi:hypothetical protein